MMWVAVAGVAVDTNDDAPNKTGWCQASVFTELSVVRVRTTA